MKTLIGEKVLDIFVKTPKEFKKFGEVDDTEEIKKMERKSFELWTMMLFMIGSDKRKYDKLIHDFSIQYVVKNDQYPKTMLCIM